jgi:hypothetical protein
MNWIGYVSLITSTICAVLILLVGYSHKVDSDDGFPHCPCNVETVAASSKDAVALSPNLRLDCNGSSRYSFPRLQAAVSPVLVTHLEGSKGFFFLLFFFLPGTFGLLISFSAGYRSLRPLSISALIIVLAPQDILASAG